MNKTSIILLPLFAFVLLGVPAIVYGTHDTLTAPYYDFKTTWQIPEDNLTVTFQIDTDDQGIVWWGDGYESKATVLGDVTSVTHTYEKAGTYKIEISAFMEHLRFGDESTPLDYRLVSVDRWGSNEWGTMKDMFRNQMAVNILASDKPDLSKVTDMSGMFYLSGINDKTDISHWDVSNVKDMSNTFAQATSFNGDLSKWDVSKVTDMSGMFRQATSFNGDLSNWDVSNVLTLERMFNGATLFNSDLSNWDVGYVTNLSYTFDNAKSFTSDLSNWDVSNVTTLERTFAFATSFTSDLSNWDVSNVTDLFGTFAYAVPFTSDLSHWDVSNVVYMTNLFTGLKSFNSDLSHWDVSNVAQMNEMFYGAHSFTSDLSDWDTSSLLRTYGMFTNAYSFTSDLSDWDMSKVTMTGTMFQGALSFNSPLNDWDVSNVQNMNRMFDGANSFNQDLSNWDLDNVTLMNHMVKNTAFSTLNYDRLLISFSKQNVNEKVNFESNSEYCKGPAETARNILLDSFEWSITDKGMTQNCPYQLDDLKDALSRETPTDDKPTDDKPTTNTPTGPPTTYNGIPIDTTLSMRTIHTIPGAPPIDNEPHTSPPSGNPPTGDPTGVKPHTYPPTGDKPTNDKPTNDKTFNDKSTDDKPTGDKPTGDTTNPPTGDKPTGDPTDVISGHKPKIPTDDQFAKMNVDIFTVVRTFDDTFIIIADNEIFSITTNESFNKTHFLEQLSSLINTSIVANNTSSGNNP